MGIGGGGDRVGDGWGIFLKRNGNTVRSKTCVGMGGIYPKAEGKSSF